MKVVSATGSNSKTTSKIDLELGELPQSIKDDIIQQTGELLVEQVLLSMADAKSPVDGEKFPKLSKEYKRKKVDMGGQPIPDLELSGDLKNALTFKATREGLELGFFGKQSGKADGHNNFSGDSQLPQRRFLPDAGQTFKSDIEDMVKGIVDDKSGGAFNESDFKGVESRAELYDVLRGIYGDLTRTNLRVAATSSSSLMDIIISLDLVGYL